jgi:hypothetical protein
LEVGWTQAPAPLQLPTGVDIEPVHEALPQLVAAAALRQAPLPSQAPVKPQGGLGAQPPCGSISSAGTFWHMPASPGTLHDWQLPHPSVAQQTPSAQWPLSHSLAAAQSCPRRLRPQAPPLQTLPGAQSPLSPQAPLQVVPLQA